MEEVIAALRTLIEAPETQPGRRLPSESDLAKGLGVGRSTVREALQVLSHLGLVESRNGLGTYVRSKHVRPVEAGAGSSDVDLRSILDFRQCIEVSTARLASARRTPAEAERIAALWEEARTHALSEDMQAFVEADLAFHTAVVAASRNALMIAAYERESANIRRFISSMLNLGPASIMTYVHDDLVQAIRDGDGDAAAAAAEESFREASFRLPFVNEPADPAVR